MKFSKLKPIYTGYYWIVYSEYKNSPRIAFFNTETQEAYVYGENGNVLDNLSCILYGERLEEPYVDTCNSYAVNTLEKLIELNADNRNSDNFWSSLNTEADTIKNIAMRNGMANHIVFIDDSQMFWNFSLEQWVIRDA